MPSIVAIRRCAELVFVPPRFDVYREVSKEIHAIFKNYTPLVEPLSLDEAYLVPVHKHLFLLASRAAFIAKGERFARPF